jgi:hypothetical protein
MYVASNGCVTWVRSLWQQSTALCYVTCCRCVGCAACCHTVYMGGHGPCYRLIRGWWQWLVAGVPIVFQHTGLYIFFYFFCFFGQCFILVCQVCWLVVEVSTAPSSVHSRKRVCVYCLAMLRVVGSGDSGGIGAGRERLDNSQDSSY